MSSALDELGFPRPSGSPRGDGELAGKVLGWRHSASSARSSV